MSFSDSSGFPGTERYSSRGADGAAFTVIAMFTNSYASLAERLRASLEAHALRYALYEVPSVHRSISRHGNEDMALTKAAFIQFAFRRFGTPVLYLDCDVVVRQPPLRIRAFSRTGRDFAIYNWLADEYTDCFVPFETPDHPSRRFYRYLLSVDLYAPEQLICSGAVQYWAPTPASERLLAAWADGIAEFPLAADDECLDFAFNNSAPATSLAYAWLDKAYARYAWWPHVRPVIDHPQLPALRSHEPLVPTDGRLRIYEDQAELRTTARAIPRDCFVDTVSGDLFRPIPNTLNANSIDLVNIGKLGVEFFLPDPS